MMKKLLIFALAAFAFAACEDDVNTFEKPVESKPDPTVEYTITVVDGVAEVDGEEVEVALADTEVTLTYDEKANHAFLGWYCEQATIDQENGTFTMPAKDVTVTARYEGVPYTITVEGGKAQVDGKTVGEALVDTEITLIPEEREGYTFAGWDGTASEVEVAEDGTFTMPDHPVTLTPTYEADVQELTVDGGTFSPAVEEIKTGTLVTLTPNVPEGKKLTRWKADSNITFTDNTFIMPAHPVAIEAIYEDEYYTITVVGGTAEPAGPVVMGTQVTLTPTAPEGKELEKWTSAEVKVSKRTNTFSMPAKNVTVTASFWDIVTPVAANAPYLLYWDGTKLGLDKWGVVTDDNVMFTKWGSIVGFVPSTSAFTADAVKFNPTANTYNTYASLPVMRFTDVNIDNYVIDHTDDAGLTAGLGDICKLVGLSLEEVKARNAAGTLDEYDSGYRLPTAEDIAIFASENQGMSPTTINGKDGVSLDNTADTFYPFTSYYIWQNGSMMTTPPASTAFCSWGTNTVLKGNGMTTDDKVTTIRIASQPISNTGEVTGAMAVRCVLR